MIDRRAVHVRDEINGCDKEVRWGMVTGADVLLDGGKAVLTQNGRTLQADIVAPAGTQFEIVSTRPASKRERQNEGTRMLAFNVEPDVRRRVTISVVLQPVGRDDSGVRVQPEALERWPGTGE